MRLEIDVNWLVNNSLTPNSLLFLQSVKDKDWESVEKQLNWLSNTEKCLMISHGYLLDPDKYEEYPDITKMQVTRKYEDLISENKVDFWNEFFANFPVKVPGRNPGTYRYVRMDNDKVRKKYTSIVKGNIAVHKRILEGLNKELEVRKVANSMQYMNNLETWLNNRVWEMYLNDEAPRVESNPHKRNYKIA